MHDSAYRIGELVMRTYTDLANAKILEVGSLNVNGCLRDAAVSTTQYVGLDLEEGPSVDFVLTPGQDFPVEDNSFDLVMASSVFEHDTRFWDTFMRMCRAARVGGHIYVNAPSNGTVHRYPMDCWRFYPDAGLALAEHARSEGMEIDMVESFIGNRHSDVWNDFVAVFRKGPTAEPLNTAFVYHRYPSRNARTWQSRAVYNESDSTEDMSLIEGLRGQCEALAVQHGEVEQLRDALAREQEQRSVLDQEIARLASAISTADQQHGQAASSSEGLVGALQQVRDALAHTQGERSALEEQVGLLSASFAEANQQHEQSSAANEALTGELSTLQSNLRQRQEEIEQAWARADQLTAERAQLQERVVALEETQNGLTTKLTEADSWIFNLSGDRRALEGQLAVVQTELEQTRRSIASMEAVADLKQQQVTDYRAANRKMVTGLARLEGLELTPDILRVQTERLYREWHADVDGTASIEGERHPLANLVGMLRALADAMLKTEQDRADLQKQVDMLNEQKTMLHKDVEMLVEGLEGQSIGTPSSETRIAQLSDTLASVRKDALEYHAKAAQAIEQLELLRAENKQQARALQALEERSGQKDRELSWLRRLFQVIETGDAGWGGLLPPQFRKKRVARAVMRHGLFDAQAYLDKYPDVADAGMDPLRHYILHGMAEGRHTEH